MTSSIVWISPQAQFGDGSASILCRKYCVRPTPVLIRLRLTQAFLERSLPLGFAQGSRMNSFRLVLDEYHWSDQRCAIQVGKVEGASQAAAQQPVLQSVFYRETLSFKSRGGRNKAFI